MYVLFFLQKSCQSYGSCIIKKRYRKTAAEGRQRFFEEEIEEAI